MNASLDADDIIAAARRGSGLEDFGKNPRFLEPLRIMLRSLADEARLNAQGSAMMRERIINLLINRLRVEDYFQRHPEIADERIEAPVVIAALPRTGTTMMHRFVASDPRMYSACWYECRYPVPFPDWRPGDPDDPRIAAAKEEVAMMLEAYPGLDAIHPMDALGPDEEIMLLEHDFCSGMAQSMADVPAYVQWENAADHAPAYRYLRKLLQFLQWQKKRAGQQRLRWVLKAPEHLGYTKALLEVFPDATVVQSHRDPVVTIPSLCSFILSGWAAFTDAPDPTEIGRQWSARFAMFMRRALSHRDEQPEQFVDIWYEDAIADPFQVVVELYGRIGMELDRDAHDAMRRWREENRREQRAPHDYSLEQFGLTREQIEADFADYRARFITGRNSA